MLQALDNGENRVNGIVNVLYQKQLTKTGATFIADVYSSLSSLGKAPYLLDREHFDNATFLELGTP